MAWKSKTNAKKLAGKGVAGTINDLEGLGTFTYQWFSDGIKVQDSSSNNYRVLSTDSGRKLKVVVNKTDGFLVVIDPLIYI